MWIKVLKKFQRENLFKSQNYWSVKFLDKILNNLVISAHSKKTKKLYLIISTSRKLFKSTAKVDIHSQQLKLIISQNQFA